MRLWNTPNFRLGTKCRGPSLGVVGNSLGFVVFFDHLGFFGSKGVGAQIMIVQEAELQSVLARTRYQVLILHGIAQTQVLVDQTSFPCVVAKIDQLFLKSSRYQKRRVMYFVVL
jgi:hypothetical protein